MDKKVQVDTYIFLHYTSLNFEIFGVLNKVCMYYLPNALCKINTLGSARKRVKKNIFEKGVNVLLSCLLHVMKF
jgi:hypothetical protein